MTKLEELKAARDAADEAYCAAWDARDAAEAACDAARDAVRDADVACDAAYDAYQAELKKTKEDKE